MPVRRLLFANIVIEFLLTLTFLGLKRRVSVVFLGLLFLPLFSQTPDSARRLLFDFQLDHANELIRSSSVSVEKLKLESLSDFLTLLSDQSELSYKVFEKQSKRLAKDLKKTFDNKSFRSSSFLFKHYLFSAIASSQYSDYPSAAKSVFRAFKYYIRMVEKHPAHTESKLAGAIMTVLSEQVPDQYAKMIPKGMSNPNQTPGFTQLKNVYQKALLSRSELSLEAGLLWVILLWEFSPDDNETWAAWMEVSKNESLSGLLSAKYVGIMAAFKSGQRDYLSSTFNSMPEEDMDRLKYLYFQRGKHLLFEFDPTGLEDLNTFINLSPRGNFVKTAWLRLGWYHLISHNDQKANMCFSKVLSDGIDKIWIDEQSISEAENADSYNSDLLKLRMLYDGGNYLECLHAIEAHELSGSLQSSSFVAEMQYRKARCLQGLKRDSESLKAYDVLLQNHLDEESYIIPQAAIIASSIAEKRGDIDAALSYLDIAESCNNHEFQKTFWRQIQSTRRRLN